MRGGGFEKGAETVRENRKTADVSRGNTVEQARRVCLTAATAYALLNIDVWSPGRVPWRTRPMAMGTKEKEMANKQAKQALEQFKMQAANEVGVNLNQGYNGDLTARQAGSIGGQMVKKMIESYEQGMQK